MNIDAGMIRVLLIVLSVYSIQIVVDALGYFLSVYKHVDKKLLVLFIFLVFCIPFHIFSFVYFSLFLSTYEDLQSIQVWIEEETTVGGANAARRGFSSQPANLQNIGIFGISNGFVRF